MINSRTIKLGPAGPTRYVIPYAPLTKDRARGRAVKNKKTGQWIAVQTKTTRGRAYESLVQEAVMQQHPMVGAFSTRLSVSLAYYVEELRGDIDNLAKCTLDGMNKGVWTDDCLIDELYARRMKCPPGIQPQTIALVRPLQPPILDPQLVMSGIGCPMCGCMCNSDIPF